MHCLVNVCRMILMLVDLVTREVHGNKQAKMDNKRVDQIKLQPKLFIL